MSGKVCDNTSVGMLVYREGKLLLIERKKYPFGFAPPAGHVDGGGSFEMAAKRELKEEAGLDAVKQELLAEGRKDNQCRRKGGDWHYWKIYRVETEGPVERSREETKQAGFYSKEDLRKMAERTEEYLTGSISEEDWGKSPGIEPVWTEWLKELGII